MLVIVTKITEAVRNADGVQDPFFGYKFHQAIKKLGVRDGPTYFNMELLSKQVLGFMQNRLREISTTKVALRTTLGNSNRHHNRPSALAADADDRQRLSEMTCKFFLFDDGCKRKKHCKAKHTSAKGEGCRNCGLLKHRFNECKYGKQLEKDVRDKDKKKYDKPKANEA
eukprot:5434571-Amphidinium_carterae.1